MRANLHKPNLFLIGAMKSGSTTLHELLAEHPDICMSEPKEPCYFIDPAMLKITWPEMWSLGFWKSEEAYLGLFSGKPDARYFGESSTDYSKLPKLAGVVERIAHFSPEARFVYIMRDPVQRTISHYWHMVEHRGETRPPLQAIQQEPHYTDVSHYALQLTPYIQQFGRDRLYVLTFEELTRDPAGTIRQLFAWLGVSTDFAPAQLSAAHNVTPSQVHQRKAGRGWLQRLRHSRLWDRLGPHVPSRLRKLGLALVEQPVVRKNVRMDEVIAYLRPIQREQTAVLTRLVGRDFPEWNTLYGD